MLIDVDPFKWVTYPFEMEPAQFSDALRLTGLSESQLREWCGKRALFQPAVAARGPGRLALFSWQDVIALRIFREITGTFGGNASRWAEGVAALRHRLEGQFFPNLWGKSAIFTDRTSATVGVPTNSLFVRPGLVFPLDPHLAIIADRPTPEIVQGELPLVTKIGPSR